MVALSIDTAANLCSVAVNSLDDGRLLSSISQDIGRGHAEILMQVITDALEQASVSYKDISKIISSIGPGSFTGVRIGLATARAIGLAREVPVVGVSVLEACAAACTSKDKEEALTTVLIDARRNEYYFQTFQNGRAAGEPALLNSEHVQDHFNSNQDLRHLICGSGIEPLTGIIEQCLDNNQFALDHKMATAPIEVFAAIGLEKEGSPSRPEPLYLRNADAKSQKGFAIERVVEASQDSA